MVDLVVTAANVQPGATGASQTTGTAGAAITAGQVVYLDSATSTYKLAKANVVAASAPVGIALNSAATGQPVTVLTAGPITAGATLAPGIGYYLSPTNAGGICPVADLATGSYPSFLGFATSATSLAVKVQQAGVSL